MKLNRNKFQGKILLLVEALRADVDVAGGLKFFRSRNKLVAANFENCIPPIIKNDLPLNYDTIYAKGWVIKLI